MLYSNILYIGDEAKACLLVMEKFNNCLSEIERVYSGWFSCNNAGKLQHYIQYHFEGGIAIFKFNNAENLPDIIRKECLMACRSLAIEQDLHIS